MGVDEGFKELTPDEYRKFEMWVAKNNTKLYEDKIAYETRWSKEQTFHVRLLDETIVTFNDILLDK